LDWRAAKREKLGASAILDSNEIRKVLKGTRLTLEALQHDLVFKQDNQSQLAAWDFRGHVAAMMDLIRKSELQGIFDLDALRRYRKNVKPIFLKFSSYFHKRQINGTKFDPWILGSAVIAGCQTGAVNGLTQFKSETAIPNCLGRIAIKIS